MGDFETTVYPNQKRTEVWASAVVELYDDDVKIFHSIEETFNYLCSLKGNICIYYHNLKFDGSFWIDFLLRKKKYKQAFNKLENGYGQVRQKDLENNQFNYVISEMGQWYLITIKQNNRLIEIRDSLKLLPFSVKRIGESFGTLHKKLDMEYEGHRYAGCKITEYEKEYISNDVLVVKEALEIMFNDGHKSLTIGGCCLKEFKSDWHKEDYNDFFPNLYLIPFPTDEFNNYDEYIRKSYHGGWCYLAHGKEDKMYYNGCTVDVNSLYPSMMSSESENFFPTGKPKYWKGKIPKEVLNSNLPMYYFIRLKTRFYIKEGKLPFIQIKGTPLYKSTECLRTSDIYNKQTNSYFREYIDIDGNFKEAIPELILTMTDYKLLLENYHLEDTEYIDGCYFIARKGIFDNYIERYKKIKVESKGAKRELAKLFLNNLYGKMATSPKSGFKMAIVDKNMIKYETYLGSDKTPVYIPCGSAITSYARNFTIRAAQANYYGENESGFIYADTDSIHSDLPPEKLKGITIHDNNFCCWKIEQEWDVGKFVRQKTYIEKTGEDYNIKCAGMPKKCKDLFIRSLKGEKANEDESKDIKKFLSEKRSIEDFTYGLEVPAKLLPKVIEGGTILVDTTYKIR